jgi:hypothetical protein
MQVRRNSSQRELIDLYTRAVGRVLSRTERIGKQASPPDLDPTALLEQLDLAIPKNRKIHIVDEAAGDLVFRVPAAISAARAQPGFRPLPSQPTPQSDFVLAVSTTVHHYTGSIWPVGYKGNDRFDFSVPQDSRLLGIELLAEPDNVHRGVRVSARPDDGSGPGSYSIHTHWWINAYQEVYYSLLVRIAANAKREGEFQLGSRYEISGFLHTSTDWEPIAPEPASGDETQVIFTQLE